MKWNDLNEATGYDVVDGNGVLKKYHDVIKSYVETRGDNPIYRGMKDTGAYVLGTGNEISRRSANTENYYTLIVDADPAWSNYPKRSKSFICSTSLNRSIGYGSLYVVIPLEHQSIGVCSEIDFWESFGDPSPADINSALYDLSRETGIPLSSSNSSALKDDLDKISKSLVTHQNIKIPYDIDYIGFRRGDNLWKAYADFMEPSKNGFTITNDVASIPDNREVWMSGNVLFIKSDTYLKEIVPMFSNTSEVTEGVNDKHIFKAIFTAGGPGSGKTTISKKLLAHKGFKEVNVDRFIEFLASKNDLDLKNMDSWDRNVKSKAHSLNKSQLDLYLDGRLPLVIDGTGRNYDKIITLSNDLKKLGYDTGLLFVNTDMETAIERNSKRSRTVAPDVVETIWKQTQANLGRFQNYFGNNLFIVDSSNTKLDLNGVAKRIDSFINSPSKSPAASKWINSQKNLTELFDTEVETTIATRGYDFTVDGITYNIRLIAGDEILFSLAGDDSNKNFDKKNLWNNSVKVFSAVYNIIKSKFTPPYKFAANLDDYSRVKLYDALSKRLAAKLNLKLDIVDKHGERFYHFTNNLNELFDTSVDIDLKQGKRKDPGGGTIQHDEGNFTFNGIDYFLRFTPSPRYVEVDYGFVNPDDDKQGSSFKPSNTLLKDAPKVLGIVKNRIKKYIVDNKPDMLFFVGDKSNGLAKLYSAMGKKLAAEFKDLGYELQENNLPRSVFFRLKKVPITETSSAGSTGAGNVATTNGNVGGLGVGFDPDGDWGIYEFAKKRKKNS
ncbi:hypothetical protein FDI40_gp053 [Agrobacterium phage Atu_ph07]|uniref:Zeta toxin domain-containing protein n=1 Tax=Agrobacterium phage Atu_ph07 TaxID=2024264 RepID=A0A2L0UZ96_9CAUD|nr:hypothetical protein FDI40_gp053 [Agrobacterium phage Atu_ph07]AUZ94865.1 hypothetical protein [Agrobacterium phage Atu_ph07]